MLAMKMLRLRFRNVVGLGVLLTAAILLLSLPPSGRSPRLLLDGFPHFSAPTRAPLALVRVGAGPDGLPDPVQGLPQPREGGRGEGTRGAAANGSGSEPTEALPEENEASGGGAAPYGAGGERGFFVQDFTPAGFVEVMKAKPATSGAKTGAKGKKPAAKSRSKGSNSPSPSSEYTPRWLKNRALSFSNSSALRVFLTEQERRSRHVTSTCLKLMTPMADVIGGARGPPRGLIAGKDIIFDRENHLAFCPVYKAASTSWTITLLEIGGHWTNKMKKAGLQKVVKLYYPRISNFAAASLTSEAIRFMVVRHPFERLLSCYRDKYENASKDYYYLHFGEKMVRRYRDFPPYLTSRQLGILQEQVRAKIKAGLPVVMSDNPFAKPVGPTFGEFVQFVIDARYDDEHWRTYYAHCTPCSVPYDFILRFESLEQEGEQFLEYLNRTNDVHPRWENPTRGATTGEVFCSYFNQLSLSQIDRLCVKYDRDFRLYEYSPDAYRKCARDNKVLNATASASENVSG